VDLGSRRLSSLRATANVRLVRCPKLAILFVIAFALTANAQSEKIVKVLPHFLDTKGRASISPSLFDRDAYQEVLRGNPAKRSGLRFNVQWKASYFPSLKLRVEAKGGQGRAPTKNILEQIVKPSPVSQWTALTIAGEDYKKFGELISWRATLLDGTNVLAEQKSFLW
jgi:hypothetical protein